MSWLWKSDATSPASFEKALSKLSSQINASNIAIEKTRGRGRRIKVIWTLYTSLAYLISLLILVLVIGPQNWSLPHYAGLVGAPVTIYSVRLAITSVFGWRVGGQESHLKHLQVQREEKISALKKATKYDSTQELLQKYGGAPAKPETPTQSPETKRTKPMQQVSRTGLPPPPTANIRSNPSSPVAQQFSALTNSVPSPPSPPSHYQQATLVTPDSPGFAPNAFTQNATFEQPSHWYDRILDVLLGEDETSSKNRIVLLCQDCRLVNGQAPPGVRTLEDIGRWRCAGCGAWNGKVTEAAKAITQMTENSKIAGEDWEKVSRGDDDAHDSVEEDHSLDEMEGTTGAKHQDSSSTTKRVTRSTGLDPVEGLD